MSAVESGVFDTEAHVRAVMGNFFVFVPRDELARLATEASEDALTVVTNPWPVLTGYSKSRWKVRPQGGNRWLLGCDADYASYVHDGLWVGLVTEAMSEAADAVEAQAEQWLAQARRAQTERIRKLQQLRRVVGR